MQFLTIKEENIHKSQLCSKSRLLTKNLGTHWGISQNSLGFPWGFSKISWGKLG